MITINITGPQARDGIILSRLISRIPSHALASSFVFLLISVSPTHPSVGRLTGPRRRAAIAGSGTKAAVHASAATHAAPASSRQRQALPPLEADDKLATPAPALPAAERHMLCLAACVLSMHVCALTRKMRMVSLGSACRTAHTDKTSQSALRAPPCAPLAELHQKTPLLCLPFSGQPGFLRELALCLQR